MQSAPISSIMTKNVVCVSPEQRIIDVKHIYEKFDFHHHIPVTDNDKLIGMISLVDFMYRINGAGPDDNEAIYNQLSVKDIMTSSPHYAKPSDLIVDIAGELAKGLYRALPIINDEHHVIGIVSTADIIKYYLENTN